MDPVGYYYALKYWVYCSLLLIINPDLMVSREALPRQLPGVGDLQRLKGAGRGVR